MEHRTLKETLDTVTCHVLEHAAFMFPEPADMSDGLPLGEFEMVAVTISFRGKKRGTLEMIAPVDFCEELASNMLGEDISETRSENKHHDAAKEIVNMIAGQLLLELYGKDALFNLAAPQIRQISKEELFAVIDQKEYACSLVDDYPVIVIFTEAQTTYEHQSTRC